ncbi:MetQ/NlpA family ABC transporter substrate-binding protein [Brevibacillus laterosporus]|uniref:MetQ/NlpA family ABC transporter substrate-binding protein n=1 Tax=Brevibacillus laterosporus TaxID=1465 RepID=UPI00264F03AB|nr:MetQ/NlpA family ABC transporter substrate-binding protein [Brevibacillus laterosporus]MDN9012081.1 MetQ/NlpA family ABC transporter substrate-binding protein [Brevibacillus laterosporus]MDO0943174.1 MetQ/NlpA family ABC transporter substrate-binding protein [Brevibacillus laterosporus]
MKKIFSTLAIGVLALSLAACGAGNKADNSTATPQEGQPVTLKVGATAVPHAEILNEVVKPMLQKENINLDVVLFQDFVMPNTQLAEKELDANYFQHIPWLEKTNKEKGLDLTYVAGIHIEPMGIYSNKTKAYKDVAALPQGAAVAITNASAEQGRILSLLEKAGLLKLKDGVAANGTVADIVEKKIELKELEPAMLPRAIDDPGIDAAVINSNFAMEAGLKPTENSIYIEEGKDNPNVNVLATRQDNKDSEVIKKLAKAMTSPEVKDFIDKKYNGAVVFVGQLK